VLDARLFAGLAGVAFVMSILGRLRVLPHANLWLHVANISFGAFYWQLFISLVCAVFGFAYFGIARLTQRPANQTVGLVGFFLVAFASAVWLASSYLTTSNSPLSRWLVILLFAAIFSFILGVTLSAANVAWVLLRK
jgi:lipopolysaccharide export LptBFGC system permease protein LptF